MPESTKALAPAQTTFDSESLVYRESFEDGPGGWWGFISNTEGPKSLEVCDGSAISRSPWWVDYNHAPPGAGYLNMLFCLNTKGPETELYTEVAGANRFLENRFPTDFTDAEIRVRIKGELLQRDSQLLLLIQGTHDGITSPWVLTGQPIEVTEDWSEQRIRLLLDESQWLCLGARHDRKETYGWLPLDKVLGGVTNNIMLVNFPVQIRPMGSIQGDVHLLRAGKDYPLWQYPLPEGYVMLDTFEVHFASGGGSRR